MKCCTKLQKRILELVDGIKAAGAVPPDWHWIGLRTTTEEQIIAFGKRLRVICDICDLHRQITDSGFELVEIGSLDDADLVALREYEAELREDFAFRQAVQRAVVALQERDPFISDDILLGLEEMDTHRLVALAEETEAENAAIAEQVQQIEALHSQIAALHRQIGRLRQAAQRHQRVARVRRPGGAARIRRRPARVCRLVRRAGASSAAASGAAASGAAANAGYPWVAAGARRTQQRAKREPDASSAWLQALVRQRFLVRRDRVGSSDQRD